MCCYHLFISYVKEFRLTTCGDYVQFFYGIRWTDRPSWNIISSTHSSLVIVRYIHTMQLKILVIPFIVSPNWSVVMALDWPGAWWVQQSYSFSWLQCVHLVHWWRIFENKMYGTPVRRYKTKQQNTPATIGWSDSFIRFTDNFWFLWLELCDWLSQCVPIHVQCT